MGKMREKEDASYDSIFLQGKIYESVQKVSTEFLQWNSESSQNEINLSHIFVAIKKYIITYKMYKLYLVCVNNRKIWHIYTKITYEYVESTNNYTLCVT